MTNTTITNFRQNIYEYVRQAVEFNDVINIATKDGNAVVLSEDEYNGCLLYTSIAKGESEIAKLRMERDIAESLYKSCQEAINGYKVQIRILEGQLQREWGDSK